MSIDEFGQFQRKNPRQRNNSQNEEEDTREYPALRTIIGYIADTFGGRGLKARVRQGSAFVLWFVYILIIVKAYVSTSLGNTIFLAIILFIIGALFQVLLLLIADWLTHQISRQRYEYVTLLALFFGAIAIFWGASYIEDMSKAYSDYKYEEEKRLQPEYTDLYDEVDMDNETYYCNKNFTSVYVSPGKPNMFREQMRKGEECTVLSSIGEYYKVTREGKFTGYVQKVHLTPLSTFVDEAIAASEAGVILSALKREKLEKAIQKFKKSRILSTEKFTDGQVYQQTTDGSYSGYVDQDGERHGSGAYQWDQDSIYIGNWQNGVMTGYGMMYYYKTGKEKNGIWKYNNLITPHRALKDDVKSGRVDSALVVRISMITAKLKYNL